MTGFFRQMTGVVPPLSQQKSPLGKIRKYGAVDFNGRKEDDSAAAKYWLERTERVLQQLHCTPEQSLECAVSLLQEAAYRWWDVVTKVVPPTDITWKFFLIEFRKKYISCVHEEEQKRSGDQQKRKFGQSSNKRPREQSSQTSDQSRRSRPRPIPRRDQPEILVVSAPGLARKCGHCNKWHKGECRGLTGACYRCGAIDHRLKDCPKRNIPRTQTEAVEGPSTTVTPLPNVTQAGEEQEAPDVNLRY
ncbi:uncharacterized protein LOC131182523 [Hevea brasiliensis]|uniref:uncharacterized protein LOC131182523 n=1 Tax=Hevea brasiliensis TaxID=3981 RepID=UPI0025CC78DD|nr:uncharacterized protein LOC131182523 [Hevea brasiliensis]